VFGVSVVVSLTGSDLGSRVTTLSTGLLLLVVRAVTATTAEGVGLGVAFTK
jgi:hypothetical protein